MSGKTIGTIPICSILSIKRERDKEIFSIDYLVSFEGGTTLYGNIKSIYMVYDPDDGNNVVVDILQGTAVYSMNIWHIEHARNKVYKLTDFL